MRDRVAEGPRDSPRFSTDVLEARGWAGGTRSWVARLAAPGLKDARWRSDVMLRGVVAWILGPFSAAIEVVHHRGRAARRFFRKTEIGRLELRFLVAWSARHLGFWARIRVSGLVSGLLVKSP
jgi:hypothetical protein